MSHPTFETEAERAAYEQGYQAGVDTMFNQWCILRSQNQQYKVEIARLREILEEKVYG